MKKMIMFGIILFIYVNISLAEQVRVIDKISLERITEDRFFQYRPSVYENKIVWLERRDQTLNTADIYLKDLTTNKITQITDTPEDENFPLIRGDFIFFTRDNNYYLFDLKTNTEQGSTPEEWEIISDKYSSAYISYPYYYGHGVNEINHRINKQVSLSEFFIPDPIGIWNNKIFYSKDGNYYLLDIKTKTIIAKFEKDSSSPSIGGSQSRFFNNIGVTGWGNLIYIFDLNTGKGYTIKLQEEIESDESLGFDGETIVWANRISAKENADKYPLYNVLNSDIYAAHLIFRIIEKNETPSEPVIEKGKSPVIEERSTEQVTQVLSGCTKDSQCEPKLCNIETGNCVECYKNICSCQEGYKSCLGKTCVKLNSKEAGRFYDCEFECKSGLGKNGQCIDPITISLSTTKRNVNVGEGTDITISIDNALDYQVEADLTITAGNGVGISSSEACQSGSRNLCKSFHIIGSKEVKHLSIKLDCIDSIKDVLINGKITYTAGDLSTTTEKKLEINCVKNSIVQKLGFFDRLFNFFRGIFK